VTKHPHPRRRKPARVRNPFLRFFKRHEHAEEAIAEAIGIDILWTALRYAVFGAAVASAATAVALSTSTPSVPNPNANLSLSIPGAALLTRHEGVRYTPYNDPYNCTVGVGHLIHYGPCSSYDYSHWKITPAQSLTLLLHDSQGAASCVRTLTHKLNQPEGDALIDLTFNAGCGSLDYSGIRNEIDAGNFAAVPATLERTAVTANGVYLKGLATRRVDEAVLFRTGYYGAGLGYYTPPKAPTAAQLLRAKTGWFSWMNWMDGTAEWKRYGLRDARVRPHVPRVIPSSWWLRRMTFLKSRRR
jgi:GH24 family phage-related lysozyme (muramidase)